MECGLQPCPGHWGVHLVSIYNPPTSIASPPSMRLLMLPVSSTITHPLPPPPVLISLLAGRWPSPPGSPPRHYPCPTHTYVMVDLQLLEDERLQLGVQGSWGGPEPSGVNGRRGEGA